LTPNICMMMKITHLSHEKMLSGLPDTWRTALIKSLKTLLWHSTTETFPLLNANEPFKLPSNMPTMQSWLLEPADGTELDSMTGAAMDGGSDENTTSCLVSWGTSKQVRYDPSMKPGRGRGFILDVPTPDFGRRIVNTDSPAISGSGGQQLEMIAYVGIARL